MFAAAVVTLVACGRGAEPSRSGGRLVDFDPSSAANRAARDSISRRFDSVEAHKRYLEQHDPAAAARERDSAFDAMLPGASAPHAPASGRGPGGTARQR